ncbi:DUF4150 domain-containing protein [Mesorhizobium sp. M1004]|uniref:DUF4150 domain-containing protein n=1 Tax=Mesorhizobium sp. M1004 TaxID=2957046 RepID=UPI00333AF885
MGNVFANGLEISGQGSDGKTIAAFPDVCFTPPENPATPPGVPIPYPLFGVSSDTEQGTGTVKISGKTVNIKNKSDLSKTSGDEAGCAAKKGIITSTNTGKEYFNSWSNDVKFDGEPVIRFTDLSTNNHASTAATAAVPWAHILTVNMGNVTCGTLLQKHNMRLHAHEDKKCPAGYESEHFVSNEYFQGDREHNISYPKWKNYDQNTAPCVCIRSYKHKKGGGYQSGKGSKKGSPHNLKTNMMSDYNTRRLNQGQPPRLRGGVDKAVESVTVNHKESKNASPKTRENIQKCLKMIFMAYIQSVVVPAKTQEELGKMYTMR